MLQILDVAVEKWPIAGHFAIARGSRTEAEVVVVHIRAGDHVGRGESVPYARYGESVPATVAAIRAMSDAIAAGLSRDALLHAMPAGAARNAIDCALFDLEAKTTGRTAAEIAGVPPLRPAETAFTLSLGTPEAMAAAARAAAARPLLKVKLGGEGDAARIAAVRAAASDARLIVDANEAWREASLVENIAACAAAGVELIEQPLPAAEDGALEGYASPIPLCADESLHTRAELDACARRYTVVNVKLDKTGGLTAALAVSAEARRLGFRIMVGCMVGTSLAMAPALVLARDADFVDLDGPLLLARAREPGLRYEGSLVYPPPPALWG